MDAAPEAYIVSETIPDSEPLFRNVKILQLLDGETQTFLQSSGRSNPQKPYAGLYYPITHVGVKADGTPWYGKIISVPAVNARLSRDRLTSVYCQETTCIKSMTVLKWQYELMRDFVVAHDAPLWNFLFDSYSARQGSAEEVANNRKKLFKLSVWLHHFNEMLEQYFATEAQLVCSCCLSLDSIWDTTFYPMKQFLLHKYPHAEAYYQAAAELEPDEPISDEELKEHMGRRHAEISPDAYEHLPVLRIEPEDDKTEIQHKSMFRNVIGRDAHLRYKPSDEHVQSFLDEPVFPQEPREVFRKVPRDVIKAFPKKSKYVKLPVSKNYVRRSKRVKNASTRVSDSEMYAKYVKSTVRLKRVPKSNVKKFNYIRYSERLRSKSKVKPLGF